MRGFRGEGPERKVLGCGGEEKTPTSPGGSQEGFSEGTACPDGKLSLESVRHSQGGEESRAEMGTGEGVCSPTEMASQRATIQYDSEDISGHTVEGDTEGQRGAWGGQ